MLIELWSRPFFCLCQCDLLNHVPDHLPATLTDLPTYRPTHVSPSHFSLISNQTLEAQLAISISIEEGFRPCHRRNTGHKDRPGRRGFCPPCDGRRR